MSKAENNKRIAKNTIMLYIRMLLIMGVTLYTSRVLLKELGVVDFGIYNVVGGVVSMLSFLNTSIANGFQRFFSTTLGQHSENELKKLFSVSLTIQIGIIAISFCIAETVGLWFLNVHMVFPPDRVFAANCVFQFVILIFVLTLLRSPIQAVIIAYERMDFYAYISIIEVFANLSIIFLLSFFEFDRLILYGFLMFLVALIITCSYILGFKRINNSLSFTLLYDKSLISSMLGFSGWNLLGSLAHLLKGNGLNILLNMFFGPSVNAARGIAYQISGGVTTFVSNFQLATRPQTIKYYAQGDYDSMLELFYSVSRFSYYLLWIISFPIFWNIDFVLNLWLGNNVPDSTALFSRIILVTSLIESFATPLTTIVHASGKMKKFQTICSSVVLSILPLSYIVLTFGYPPESAMYVSLCVVTIVHLVRLFLLKEIIKFNIKIYFQTVVLPCLKVTLVTVFIIYLYNNFFYDFYGLLNLILLFIIVSLIVFYVGLQQNERKLLQNKILKKWKFQKSK